MAGPISSRPHTTHEVAGQERATRGEVDGLPVLTWGHADRARFATVRQLRALGLRPGGAEPVALLAFGHRVPGRRPVEYTRLYDVSAAAPKREATPAQREAIGEALAARRTCTTCGRDSGVYLGVSTGRRCTPCADAAGTWDPRAGDLTEHGPDPAGDARWDAPGIGDAAREAIGAALAAADPIQAQRSAAGGSVGRARLAVVRRSAGIYCLGRTRGGAPRHPLYLHSTTRWEHYVDSARTAPVLPSERAAAIATLFNAAGGSR